jgi:hypothetical protein
LVLEIQRGALVGPATDVAHGVWAYLPLQRSALQAVGDGRDVTKPASAGERGISSIEVKVERVGALEGRQGMRGNKDKTGGGFRW